MIAPTIGRQVWYHPGFHEESLKNPTGQPCAATVAYVHSDSRINLSVIDWKGQQVRRESVLLLQEGDAQDPDSPHPYAVWMPYQIGQAKKDKLTTHEAAEILRLAEDSARDSGNDV